MKVRVTAIAVAIAAIALVPTSARAQADANVGGQPQQPITKQLSIVQHLGGRIPKDVPFKDENGKDVKLGDMFHGRPVLFIPMFFNCQTGCAMISNDLIQTLAKSNDADELLMGRDMDVVMVSIHPKETPDLAKGKKSELVAALTALVNHGRPAMVPEVQKNAGPGLHLLTGSLDNIHRFTNAIGFSYRYDAVKNLVQHPTCSVMTTPEGVISSYTIGNDFPTKILQANLDIAKKNEVGQKADQSSMFGCLMIDPATGKTTVVVEQVMKLAGFLTIFILFGSIIRMTLKNRRATLLPGGKVSST